MCSTDENNPAESVSPLSTTRTVWHHLSLTERICLYSLFRNGARAGFVVQNSSHNLSKLIDVVRFKTVTGFFFNQNVVKWTFEQIVKSQRGSRSIAVHFL